MSSRRGTWACTVLFAVLLGGTAPVRAERRRTQPRGGNERPVLMSLKPRHAHRLLIGEKGYEMRRICPGWGQGTNVLLYASGPNHADDRGKTAKSLVGCFTAGEVQRGSPVALWLSLGIAGAAKFEPLIKRFKGREGHAIEITGPRRLQQPVSLDRLRQQDRSFRPPQMYQYIDRGQQNLLTALNQGLRRGVAPSSTAATTIGNGSSDGTARPWIANRRVGNEQLFVFHEAYTWSGRQIPEPLLAASYGRSNGVLQALESGGLAPTSRVSRPRALPVADLRRVHSQEYIDHVLQGRPAPPADPSMSRRDLGALGPLKEGLFGSWNQQRAQKALLAAGGTYSAAHLALERKSIVGNLAPGSHHVAKSSADGLATFNGPVIAARKLIHERAVQRVMIIDGDLNYGGGTSRLTASDPSIAYVSVYGVPTGQPYRGGTNDARPVPRKATDSEYLATFSRGLAKQIDRFRPELIIYNASANPLRSDPVNATAKLQVSKEALSTRDALVFALARSRGVPVCWELGSGYGGDNAAVSTIHRNTAEAANRVLSRVRPGDQVRFAGASAWSARGGVVTFPRWSVRSNRAADLLGPPPSSTPPTD